jgi:hypothetical protein
VTSSWRNTPERIVEKARPLLEPDEAVAHVVRAMEGPPKWVALVAGVMIGLVVGTLLLVPTLGIFVMWLVFTGLYKRRVLLATDRNLVVLGGGRFRFTPRTLLHRLDIETKIGPTKGLWMRVVVAGRGMYVVPRTVPELQAADREVDEA